jgi:hypothetical protein
VLKCRERERERERSEEGLSFKLNNEDWRREWKSLRAGVYGWRLMGWAEERPTSKEAKLPS